MLCTIYEIIATTTHVVNYHINHYNFQFMLMLCLISIYNTNLVHNSQRVVTHNCYKQKIKVLTWYLHSSRKL